VLPPSTRHGMAPAVGTESALSSRTKRLRPAARAPRTVSQVMGCHSGTSGRQQLTVNTRVRVGQHGDRDNRQRTGVRSRAATLDAAETRTDPVPVVVGEGLRSGRGPVAEFLVGAAALSTARIHRVLSSARVPCKGGATGEGPLASARMPRTTRRRVPSSCLKAAIQVIPTDSEKRGASLYP
jgi:hypothetical protein